MELESAMTSQIKVYGKAYTVKRTSKQIDLHELAKYVDSKMQELSYSSAKLSTIDLAILTALNITQELMELKSEVRANEELLEEKTGAMVEQLSEILEKNNV